MDKSSPMIVKGDDRCRSSHVTAMSLKTEAMAKPEELAEIHGGGGVKHQARGTSSSDRRCSLSTSSSTGDKLKTRDI